MMQAPPPLYCDIAHKYERKGASVTLSQDLLHCFEKTLDASEAFDHLQLHCILRNGTVMGIQVVLDLMITTEPRILSHCGHKLSHHLTGFNFMTISMMVVK